MPSPALASGRAVAIVNARSGTGNGPQVREQLTRAFGDAGVQCEVAHAEGGEELQRAVQRALDGDAQVIVAAGGDGTQSAVAAALAGTDRVQGVLPLGTLNHFAKDLGIPLKLEDAVRTIVEGRVQEVDVGEVNGRIFINNSSLGLYPQIVRERELQQFYLGKSKWAALASAVLHVTRRPYGIAVRVESEDDEQLRRTPFVFIGNNPYTMEGFSIGARSSLQGGQLALYMARRRGRLALVRLAIRALLKRLDQACDFEVVTGETFVIRTRDPRIRVATDGEVTMLDTPLEYRIRPKALRVLVPAAA